MLLRTLLSDRVDRLFWHVFAAMLVHDVLGTYHGVMFRLSVASSEFLSNVGDPAVFDCCCLRSGRETEQVMLFREILTSGLNNRLRLSGEQSDLHQKNTMRRNR